MPDECIQVQIPHCEPAQILGSDLSHNLVGCVVGGKVSPLQSLLDAPTVLGTTRACEKM